MPLKAKRILQKLRNVVVYISSKNRVFSRLYFLISGDFDREYEFTLKGRSDALNHRYTHSNSNANIRRGIHRLEKGLFHESPKAKFGKEVFTELENEIRSYNLSRIDQKELGWLLETLKSYIPFSHEPQKVRKVIEIIKPLFKVQQKTPVNQSENSREFEVFERILKKRKSVRFFRDNKVSIEKVERCVEIAKLAPTACNRQPYHMELLTNKKDILKVGNLAPGTSGWIDGVPALGVIIGHSNSFRFARDRHLIYFDSALFVSNLVNALVSEGLSSCICNWVPNWGADRQAIKYLGYDLSKTIVCLVAIGEPKEIESPVSTKKETTNILRFRH